MTSTQAWLEAHERRQRRLFHIHGDIEPRPSVFGRGGRRKRRGRRMVERPIAKASIESAWQRLRIKIRTVAARSKPSHQGRCDDDVMRNGRSLLAMANVGADVVEVAIRGLARITRRRINWHYISGYANVLVIGDIDRDLLKARDRMVEAIRDYVPSLLVRR